MTTLQKYMNLRGTQGAAWALLVLLAAAAVLEPSLIRRAGPRVVAIGGADLGLARNWGYKEWSDSLPGPYGAISSMYRWSGARSQLVFTPVAQRQPHLLFLSLLGGRPDNTVVAPVAVEVESQPLNAMAVGSTLRHYQLLVPGPRMVERALEVQLLAPTMRIGDDMRDIGVVGVAAQMLGVGQGRWWLGLTFPLFLAGLGALVAVCGSAWLRVAGGVALSLLVLTLAGLVVPALVVESARTLAGLCWIAALVVGVARLLAERRTRMARWAWHWGAAGMLVLGSLFFTPTIASDGVAYYAYVRSLAVDGDLEFTNEFIGPDVPFQHPPTRYATSRTITGRAANEHAVGAAVMWAPFWAVGSLVIALGNLAGAGWSTNGYALPHIALVNLASLLALPLTAWLSYLTTRRLASASAALLASISLVVGSALLYFGLFEGTFVHPLAAAAVAAYFWWWTRTRPARAAWHWLVLGLLAGLMCMIYWINAILLALPALDLLLDGVRALRRQDWRRLLALLGFALLFSSAMLLAFSPQMMAWNVLYGAPLTVPQGSGFAVPSEFKALALLVSPLHGMLLWAPISVLGVIGLAWYMARRGLEGWLVALVFGLYFLYNATLLDWHGSGTFGPRRLANVWPLLVPGLALLLDSLRRRARWLPLAVCTLAVTWSTAVLVRFATYQLPRQPSELDVLSVAEFVLAPNNLPWSAMPSLMRGALAPRMIASAVGSGSVSSWVQCSVLLTTSLLLVLAAMRCGTWLNGRQSRAVSAAAGTTSSVPASERGRPA